VRRRLCGVYSLEVVAVARDREARARKPPLELRAQVRELRLHGKVIGAIAEQHGADASSAKRGSKRFDDPAHPALGVIDA
jgi:hypothetical protein